MSIDLWGYTNAGSVGFRKETKVNNSTLIKRVDKNTKLWVYSSETVDGEKWYNVMVNGKEGFILAEYVTLYSREESDKLQSSSPRPCPPRSLKSRPPRKRRPRPK